MLEELKKILDKYKNTESSTEDSYYQYLETGRVDEDGYPEEECIDDDIYNLFKKYPEIIHRYDYICGFDSPGYTLNSYVLTIVINNEIYNFPLNYEMY